MLQIQPRHQLFVLESAKPPWLSLETAPPILLFARIEAAILLKSTPHPDPLTSPPRPTLLLQLPRCTLFERTPSEQPLEENPSIQRLSNGLRNPRDGRARAVLLSSHGP